MELCCVAVRHAPAYGIGVLLPEMLTIENSGWDALLIGLRALLTMLIAAPAWSRGDQQPAFEARSCLLLHTQCNIVNLGLVSLFRAMKGCLTKKMQSDVVDSISTAQMLTVSWLPCSMIPGRGRAPTPQTCWPCCRVGSSRCRCTRPLSCSCSCIGVWGMSCRMATCSSAAIVYIVPAGGCSLSRPSTLSSLAITLVGPATYWHSMSLGASLLPR